MLNLALYGMLAVTAAPTPETIAAYEVRETVVKAEDGTEQKFAYRLLRPASVEPGKEYPLVLFLHGAGERGDDNVRQLEYFPEWMAGADYREKFPCFVIAPQCPERQTWSGLRIGGGGGGPLPDEISSPARAALQAVDEVAAEMPVDGERLYLTGLSMGGFGSWQIAAKMPEKFAAVAPICGGGKKEWADALARVPLWVVHGDADPVVPVRLSREMVEAVKAAGGQPRYQELPGVEHDSWTPAYKGDDALLRWMFEQRKGGGE